MRIDVEITLSSRYHIISQAPTITVMDENFQVGYSHPRKQRVRRYITPPRSYSQLESITYA